MGRDPDVRAALEHALERQREVVADDLRVGVGDHPRLEIDPLAEPEVRGFGGQGLDVVHRAPQASLKNDADAARELRPQRSVDRKRTVGALRVFHVDPDESARLRRRANERTHVFEAASLSAATAWTRSTYARVFASA